MICTRCKKNPAVMIYKQNINGHKTEQALCADCLRAERAAGAEDPFADLLGGFFFPAVGMARQSGTVKACGLCGSTFRQLQKTGKVGCAKCYETFREELTDSVQSIHGHTRHVGRRPAAGTGKGKTEKVTPKTRIEECREQLQKAIGEEDFENAALLRDEIRRLEAQSKGGTNRE